MNIQHVDLVAGEDRTITFTARDRAQELLNLTGASIAWRAARCRGDDAVLEKTGSIVSASGGTFSVALTDTDTAALSGDYEHIGLVTIAGATTAAVSGRLRVRDSIE